MLKQDDPVTRSLALLIQLFGRDVVDRIREAGFDNPIAIARAGPETVAARGEIALPLARRIVAVAMETEGVADLPDPIAPPPETRAPRARRRGTGGSTAAAAPASGALTASDPAELTASASRDIASPAPAVNRSAREKKRPARGAGLAPETTPESGPVAASSGLERQGVTSRAAAEAEKVTPRAAAAGTAPEDSDPFVDDAALISWMGFNARTGGLPRTASIAVSEAILDPPAKTGPAKSDPETVSRVTSDSGPVPASQVLSEPGTGSALPVAPDPGPAARKTPDGPVTARRMGPAVMPGSFWSFGRRRQPGGEGGNDGR